MWFFLPVVTIFMVYKMPWIPDAFLSCSNFLQPPMAGYAVDTKDPAKAGLHCCECGLILKEAVQTWEGQRMCKECFDTIKE